MGSDQRDDKDLAEDKMRHPLLKIIPLIVGGLTQQLSGQSFAPTGSMKEARWQHTATVLNNGTVLVTGGYTGSGFSNTAEIYNPQTGVWRYTVHPMNTARNAHAAVKLLDGRVLIAAGTPVPGTGEIFDPATEQFTPTAPMNESHNYGPAALLPDGRVVVLAGNHRNGIYSGPNDSEVYDPAANTWTVVPAAIAGFSQFTATRLPAGKILAAGGYDGYTRTADNTVSFYDGILNSQQALTGLLVPRLNHTATLLPDGRVLIVAGTDPSYSIASTEIYDPNALPNGSSSFSTSLNQVRRAHTATLLANGDVLAIGGFQAPHGGAVNAYLNTAELRDHITGNWSLVGPMSAARQSHTATLLPNGAVLIAGRGSTSPLSTAEIWAPSGNKPQVLIVPGFLGTKLATINSQTRALNTVVWLSNVVYKGAASHGLLFDDTTQLLAYNSQGQPTTQLAPAGLLNLVENPTGKLLDELNCSPLDNNIGNNYLYDKLASCQTDMYTYNGLKSQLEAAGYSVLTFPYDWRRDVRDLAQDLYSAIQSVLTNPTNNAQLAIVVICPLKTAQSRI